jgi:superfamily II DNA helicase RecQ
MSRKVERVAVQLHPQKVKQLTDDEIKIILRGADELIGSGGRTLLAKILKGSRDKKVIELGLNQSPVYGKFQQLSLEEITAKIDWTIKHYYLAIEYSGRLPLLVYTEKGWEIERETYARELLHGFDEMLQSGERQFDMEYLKDRNRDLILLLLDMVEETMNKEYLPILKAWEQIDYKKVRQRIREVINHLEEKAAQPQNVG